MGMHKKHEQGFVSIIVASLLMIMLTLITIGLSRLMQREQRQALDRQLSAQAFYAAESGVNDVQARIQASTLPSPEKADCDVTNWPSAGANGVLDSANPNIAYTCLIYDTTPSSLEFNNGAIKSQQSRIFPVQSAGVGFVRSLTFEWSGENNQKTIAEECSANFSLPSTRPNTVPILRVDIVRFPVGGSYSRDAFIDQTTTLYLYPQDTCGITAGDYADYTAPDENGQMVGVNCDPAAVYACSFTIEAMDAGGLGTDPASDRYIIRLKSIYNNADVRLTATSSNPVPFEFLGAQTLVESTGRASDVKRRIRVHLSNSTSYPIPEYVVQAMDGVCKRLDVVSPAEIFNNCTY
jgi:type II secretory pathway pseudopilin PulG